MRAQSDRLIAAKIRSIRVKTRWTKALGEAVRVSDRQILQGLYDEISTKCRSEIIVLARVRVMEGESAPRHELKFISDMNKNAFANNPTWWYEQLLGPNTFFVS